MLLASSVEEQSRRSRGVLIAIMSLALSIEEQS
jgi:hypothetical protein